METKVCGKCGQELPMTKEYFIARKDSKDGFRNDCKMCRAEYDKEYYQDNNAVCVEHNKKYYQDNKMACTEYKKQYYQDNKLAHDEKGKLWCQANKVARAEHSKKYRKGHPELYRMCSQRRRALKLQLPHSLTVAQWEKIKIHFNNKCCYCGKELPLEQEHFIPVVKLGSCDHDNIIPSCRSCNSSKGPRSFFEWYPKYMYYSKKREKVILEYLNYDKQNIQQLSVSI